MDTRVRADAARGSGTPGTSGKILRVTGGVMSTRRPSLYAWPAGVSSPRTHAPRYAGIGLSTSPPSEKTATLSVLSSAPTHGGPRGSCNRADDAAIDAKRGA